MASAEQEAILGHPGTAHGRVLAGPGTGKSTTVLELAERLREENPELEVRLITFTRAATSELIEKAAAEGRPSIDTSTVHSFALSILMRNPGLSPLPEPLRIPDEYEAKEIRSDLAARLRRRGVDINAVMVARLERELAASWESLDPDLVLLADADPAVRNAYVAEWRAHRSALGYSLFAEMPLYASQLVEDHPDLDVDSVQFLIVDEYQDLNMSEIALVRALAETGVAILAVGDDDQSIYSWRMAHPAGIRDFPVHVGNAVAYSLTTSFRCGSEILTRATRLIETATGRVQRPSLAPGPDNPAGTFEYLRFTTQNTEAAGVAAIVRHLIDDQDVDASEIVIMMRSDPNGTWSGPLRSALDKVEVGYTDVESALEPLTRRSTRQLLAVARLAANAHDDLAWWTLLRLTSGIADGFVTCLLDEAIENGERFHQRLLRCADEPPVEASTVSLNAALALLARVKGALEQVAVEGAPESDRGWADWVLSLADELEIQIEDDLRQVLVAVGELTPQADGVGHYLNQLEPVTKDLALRRPGVALMTIAKSKGLTYRSAVVVGVEEGVIPSPRADSEEEERRLLYVGMTRAREHLYLTMAQRRTGPTARSGRPNVQASRSRCPLFRDIGIAPTSGPAWINLHK